MDETKYGKYFINYDPKSMRVHPLGPRVARLDDTVADGCFFYSVHWVLPDGKMPNYMPLGHPPHIHKDPELLFHIGTNPDDPMDLGAEVEIFMGKELERHVITRSSVVYIPPNFIHCPWRPLKTSRPWLFIEVNQGPRHTEKLFPQILPKELRDQMDWEYLKGKEEGY
jgi:hypothetical protein